MSLLCTNTIFVTVPDSASISIALAIALGSSSIVGKYGQSSQSTLAMMSSPSLIIVYSPHAIVSPLFIRPALLMYIQSV